MSTRSIDWSTGVWLLICASLSSVSALEVSRSLPLAPQVTASPPTAARLDFASELAPLELPPRDAFDEIAARPLFSESRHPFVAPQTEVAGETQPADENLSVELVGTLLRGELRAALLQPAGQSSRWLREGEQIAGWQIERIEPARIVLGSGDEAKTLELRADLAGPTTPVKKGTEDRRSHTSATGDGEKQADHQPIQPSKEVSANQDAEKLVGQSP
jgi:hypothetical protein